MRQHLGSLWSRPEFMKLWAAQTISEFGSRVTREGLPLTALMILHAGPAEVGLLAALATAPRLLVGLVAGGFVDHAKRRPVMIAADLGRAVILASVPIASLMHLISLAQLYGVAFLAGSCSVVFDIENQAYYPALVGENELIEANTKFSVTMSLANVGGPALAGGLIQVLTAPIAIAATSLSYLGSAGFLVLIRKNERSGRINSPGQWWRDLQAGVSAILSHSIGRAIWGMETSAALFIAMFAALYPFVALQELHLTPAMFGLTFAAGGFGALAGAAVRTRLTRRLGVGPVALTSALFAGVATLAIPLTRAPPLAAMLILGGAQFIGDALTTLSGISVTSLRQLIFPTSMLGRVGSVYQFAAGGMAMTGALLGGLLGKLLGPREAAMIAAAGLIASILWGWLSPFRRVQELPHQAQEESPTASTSGE